MTTTFRPPGEARGRPAFLLGKASLTLLLAAALSLTFGVSSASADTADYSLSVPNSGISGFTGPYGNVHVDLTSSTTADITLTSNTVGGNIYLFGDGNTLALNVNASVSSLSVGTITGSNAGTGFTNDAGDSTATIAANQNVSEFGKFNFTITTFDGFEHSVDTLSFTLTRSTGTWASASDVLTENSQGALAAAHVFVTESPAVQSNGAIITGFAGNGDAQPIPEPASIVLVGLGAVGAFGYGLRRRLLVPRPA